jgi:hypothetical protein
MNKDTRFRPDGHMTAEQKTAFKTLNEKLVSAPILAHPDWSIPFIVSTDACPKGIGATLTQKVGKFEKAIAYISRSLRPAEKNYCQYRLEALAVIWACEVFRPYILARKFKLVTDCKALMWIKGSSQKGIMGRWVMRLQEYDYDITHRPGKQHGNADGMSRNPIPLNPESTVDVHILEINTTPTTGETETNIKQPRPKAKAKVDKNRRGLNKQTRPIESFTEFIEHQRNDTRCRLAIDILEGIHTTENPPLDTKHIDKHKSPLQRRIRAIEYHKNKFIMHENALYTKPTTSERSRLVVPDSLVQMILRQHHGRTLGHPGQDKLVDIIKQRYTWPGIHRDCRDWVSACLPCQRRKTPRPTRAGLTTPIVATEAFEHVAIDIVGPFTDKNNQKKFLLTMLDGFTRWPIAVVVDNETTRTVTDAIHKHLITKHGTPKFLASDKASGFTVPRHKCKP